jgi:hypothetical protein
VLPAGNRNSSGNYNNVSNNANLWSSTEYDSSNAWNRNLNYNHTDVNRNNNNKDNGRSVRCLRDLILTCGRQKISASQRITPTFSLQLSTAF